MKKGGSKAKGSAWERALSKILTKWLTGQDNDYYFYRSPGSGALANLKFGNKSLSGDIIALKPEACFFTDIFNVESKTGYEGASFDKFLKENKNDILQKFWEQSSHDAKNADKLPLVIFKKKGMQNPWIAFNSAVYDKCVTYISTCRLISLYYGNLDTIYFMNLYDFLDKLKPITIKKLWNME